MPRCSISPPRFPLVTICRLNRWVGVGGGGGLLFAHLKINSGLVKEKAGLLGRICACFDEEALLLILSLVAYTSLHGGGLQQHITINIAHYFS